MPAIRRTNLSHRTHIAAVKDIQEQVKLTSNAKHGVKLNGIYGIEIKNIEMLRLTPIELHSIIAWKSITVHSKSLLLDQ